MAHIINLKAAGQRPRPNIGKFQWNTELNRFEWRGKVYRTAEEIAAGMNEVLPWLRQQNSGFLEVSIIALDEAKPKSKQLRSLPVLALT
jgi:hypothetical protein